MFGSVARGEATADSDIDVVVTTRRPFSLLDLVALKRCLEGGLGRTVDIIDRRSVHPATPLDALRPALWDELLRDLHPVF